MSQLEVSSIKKSRPSYIKTWKTYAQAEKLDLDLDSPRLK